MKTLKTVVATVVVVALLIPLAAFAVIWSGAYNVAATSGHWPMTEWVLSQTVQQSVAARAEAIKVPALGGHEQVLTGAANFDAMCAGCHAAPGVEQGLPGAAMSPRPPRLNHAAEAMPPAQLFWVIKHGIKASGMPAWGPSHSDADIWSMVAFIQRLPQMSAAEYAQLQQAADAGGMGHHGHGGDTQGGGHAHGNGDAHAAAEAGGDAQAEDDTHAPAEDDTAHGADGHSHSHPH